MNVLADKTSNYSDLKSFAGFASDVFTTRKLIVNIVIAVKKMPATIKLNQLIATWYAKF